MVAKVISESFQPPGGNLINLVAIMAAHKYNTVRAVLYAEQQNTLSKGKTGVMWGCYANKLFVFVCVYHPICVLAAIRSNRCFLTPLSRLARNPSTNMQTEAQLWPD